MLKTTLFPKFCFGCGFMGCYICLDCQKKILIPAKDTCLYCGKGSYSGLTHFNCKRIGGLDGVLSIYKYSTVLKRIIKGIKYKLVREAFREFFLSIDPVILAEKLSFYKKLDKKDLLLQSVPLHGFKTKSRGFNQADKITSFLNYFIKADRGDFLIKTKETKPQAVLTKTKRSGNIYNSFGLKKNTSLSGKSVVLVDDIITTGSTMKAIAKIIKKNGAYKVYALSLARG